MNSLSWILVYFILLVAELMHPAKAAKFLRNNQVQQCLQRTSTASSTSGCFTASMASCPVNRFDAIPDSVEWNIVPITPTSNTTDFLIESSDNKLCLTADASNAVEVCPCDIGKTSQRWKSSAGNWMSGSSCLATVASAVGLNSCQAGSDSLSWQTLYDAPDSVTIYEGSLFTQKSDRLPINTYTANQLPSTIFSSPFSVEIPPGFEFIISFSNNNTQKYEFDVPQMEPISDLTATVTISIKPGIVIYEQPAYFGGSQYLENGNTTSAQNQILIGSAMVPNGSLGVIWQSQNFSGSNFGLYEPIANFTGVMVAAPQINAGSLDVSDVTCSPECASGGYCSGKNTCTCKPGFTGARCEACLPGFWGPNCQACPSSCNNNSTHFACDDGISGTGKCHLDRCTPGFMGSNCTVCAPGYAGPSCKACNCGNGSCDSKGTCYCNAGWDNDPNNNSTKCTVPKKGYYQSGTDVHACKSGCTSCNSNKCLQCSDGFVVSQDDQTSCTPNSSSCPSGQYFDGSKCASCSASCKTCSGPNSNNCIQCPPSSYFVEGSCVQANSNGQCATGSIPGSYFVNNAQGLCDACPSSCTNCSIPNFSGASLSSNVVCSQCTPGFVLDNGVCKSSCPAGKYLDPSDAMTCRGCHSSCGTCSGPQETQCLSCSNTAQFAFNGTCSSQPCPSSFVALNTSCTKCHSDCAECTGSSFNQCSKCPPNRPILANDSQCVEVCPMGTYADSTGKCRACNKDCSSCVGPNSNQCLGCADQSKVLLGGSCSGTCPSGSTLVENQKLCKNTVDNSIVSPLEDNTSNTKSMPWWAYLLIILSAIILVILFLFMLRRWVIKRRLKKTEEFRDQVDENAVAGNMLDLYNQEELDEVKITGPETSHGPASKAVENDPPAYDPKGREAYMADSSLKGEKNKNYWEGFDDVVLNDGEGSKGPGKKETWI